MSRDIAPAYDLRSCRIGDVRALCERHHGYGGAGNSATYAFGVWEEGAVVAAFLWQPPSLGASKSVCPSAPHGVLSLSRMVAVPRAERRLRHISKPLRRQMRMLIDRGRWPALVTYHDEGQGHTGHVYKCSGWTPTVRRESPAFEDPETGRRVAPTTSGTTLENRRRMVRVGTRWLQRWEQWACTPESAAEHITAAGWVRVPIPGKKWRSGAQAHRWEHNPEPDRQIALFGAVGARRVLWTPGAGYIYDPLSEGFE